MKKPMLIVKPSGMKCLRDILEIIETKNYDISEWHPVRNFSEFGRNIYDRDIKSRDEEFHMDMEAHLWTEEKIYGKDAIVIMLRPNELIDKSIETILKEVDGIKKSVREVEPDSRNGTYSLVADINKIKGNKYLENTDKRGFEELEVTDVKTGEKRKGCFREYYFKLVHAPDSADELEFAHNVLENMGIKNDRRPKESLYELANRLCRSVFDYEPEKKSYDRQNVSMVISNNLDNKAIINAKPLENYLILEISH